MRCGRYSRGFTLVEILVVLLILSISIGLVILNPGQNEQAILQREADRLLQILEMAQDEAVMQGQEFGLQLSGHDYQIMLFDKLEQQWQSLEQRQFASHSVSELLAVKLLVDNKKVASPDAVSIMLYSSGESSVFSLTLSLKNSENTDEISSIRVLASDGSGVAMR
jgi:general secretion pathway protein H